MHLFFLLRMSSSINSMNTKDTFGHRIASILIGAILSFGICGLLGASFDLIGVVCRLAVYLLCFEVYFRYG